MHSLLTIELSRTLAQDHARRPALTETRARRPRLAELLRPLPVRRRSAKTTVARGTT